MLAKAFNPVHSLASEERLKFNLPQHEENYQFLKNSGKKADFFNPIKHIPLNNSSSFYLTLGGEMRLHFEYIDDNNWGKGTQDQDGYFMQRYLTHANIHFGKYFRVFSQLMSGTISGRNGGPRGVDQNSLDWNQGFMEVRLLNGKGQVLRFKAGRQEIIFGSRRFFNYRERPNSRLSHDAIMAIFQGGSWDIRAFGASPVKINRNVFDDKSGKAKSVWGVYGVKKNWSEHLNIDLYYLGLHDRDAVYDQGQEEETRQTLGTRVWGKWNQVEYNFELLYQFGTFGRGDIDAYAITSDTSYSIPFNSSGKLRFSLRADVYSGDNGSNDSDLNSFNPFFPKGKHISQLAATGLINQRDLHPRISVTVDKNWFFTTSTLFIWRDSLNDGIYSIGNELLVSGQSSQARYVGTQPELEIKYTFNSYLDLKATFVYFKSGSFIRQASSGQDITYLSSMLTIRF